MNKDIAAQLRAPFPPESIGKLPRITCKACRDRNCDKHRPSKCRTCKGYLGEHMHLDYVGHAHVRERLMSVDPEWSWEPLAFNSQGLPAMTDDGCLWIRLTVGGKTMLGVGDAPGKRGGDAAKECIGDALRNAALSFGVALDLWKKEAPGEDVPTREVERPKQTPEDRAKELRGQIAAIGKRSGKGPAAVADDFAEWSKGQDIREASVAVLAEYKAHLQNGAPA